LIRQWITIRTRDHTGQKSYSTPSEASLVFPQELLFFDRKTSEALGMHHLQATVTMLLWIRMWFLNVWDNVPMDLKYVCQQYFTCMCFLGFIRYNKTFIACGFRKYENLFTHEYHIPLGRCPQGKWWYSWVNKFSYFPHQHAINVYSLAFCTFSFQFKESTLPDTRCLIQDVVSPHCGDKSMARYCTRSSPSNYFIMTSYHWNAG
jgi:hypothetical protein